MYSYYGLSSLGQHMQPYLWWKRYLTQIQIGQFVVLFLHGIYFISHQEGYSLFIQANYLLQASLYLVLFTQFYFKTYSKKQSKTVNVINNNGNDVDKEKIN